MEKWVIINKITKLFNQIIWAWKSEYINYHLCICVQQLAPKAVPF